MSCHYRHVSVAKRCCQWSEQQFFVLLACDCQGHLACDHHHPHLKSADHVTNADVNGITKHSPIWLTLPAFQWCPYKPVLVTRCSFQSPNEHLECETTPSPPSFPYLSDRAEAPPPVPAPFYHHLLSQVMQCLLRWEEWEGGRYVWTDKRHQQNTLASITTN